MQILQYAQLFSVLDKMPGFQNSGSADFSGDNFVSGPNNQYFVYCATLVLYIQELYLSFDWGGGGGKISPCFKNYSHSQAL
mgnify:CR=1 FL=1